MGEAQGGREPRNPRPDHHDPALRHASSRLIHSGLISAGESVNKK